MISRRLYYLSEFVINTFFENITGARRRTRELEKVKIVQLGQERRGYVDEVRRKLEEEFGAEVEVVEEIIPVPKRAIEWGSYVFTPFLAPYLSKFADEGSVIVAVTRYGISVLPPLRFFWIFYRFTRIMGVAYPLYRVALITTMNDRLKSKVVAETAVHELAHLIGKHGYDPKSHSYGYDLLG
ncbi:MAG: hypothetical protein SVM80_07720 [Halobacteriota archaeon]|nr:hypothetical protein [Halobacteriota archaeon]